MVRMRFTLIEFVNLSHRVCMHKSNFEPSDLDNGLEKWCNKHHFSAHKLLATTVYHPLNLDYHPLQPQMELLPHYSYNPQAVSLSAFSTVQKYMCAVREVVLEMAWE